MVAFSRVGDLEAGFVIESELQLVTGLFDTGGEVSADDVRITGEEDLIVVDVAFADAGVAEEELAGVLRAIAGD